MSLQPPLRDVNFRLDKMNEDEQNDFLNGALEQHMALEERKKALCKIEEKKFYRGEDSMIDQCNLGCITSKVEQLIALYVSLKVTN